MAEEGSRASRRARLAAALAVGGILAAAGLATTLPFAAARGGEPAGIDAPAYVRIARTFAATGSLVLPPPGRIDPDTQQHPETAFGTPWALARDGRLLPKHSWLFGLLLVPGVALGGAKGAMVEAILLGAALGAFVTWRAARDFGALPAAAAALVLLWASPAGFWQVTGVNLETAIAFLLVAALAAAADGRPLAAGLLAGFSPLLRPTAPVLFLGLPFVLRARRRPGEARRLLFGLLPGLALFAAANTLAFGAPWITPYQRSAVFDGHAFRVVSHAGAFGAPVLHGLKVLLLDERSGGLLWYAPAALVAMLGYALPRARSAERLGATLPAAAAYLLLASYAFLGTGFGGNYRFALPFVVSAVAPLAAMFGVLAARLRRT